MIFLIKALIKFIVKPLINIPLYLKKSVMFRPEAKVILKIIAKTFLIL